MADEDQQKAYWMQRAIDKVNQSYRYMGDPFSTAIQYLKNSNQWGGEIVDYFMAVTLSCGRLAAFLNKNKSGYSLSGKKLPSHKPLEDTKK